MKTRYLFVNLLAVLWVSVLSGQAAPAVKAIALSDQNLPEGDGKFNVMNLPAINLYGQVVFRSTLKNTSLGAASDTGLYLYDGASLSKVVRENESVPEGNGLFEDMPGYRINADGDVAFQAVLKSTSGGSADNSALYIVDHSFGTYKLARKGETEYTGNGTFDDLSIDAFNSRHAAFNHSLTNTSGGGIDDSAIFLSAGFLYPLVRENTTVPGGNGKYSTLYSPQVDSTGGMAFRADLKNTSGGALDDSAIYRFRAGFLEVARENALIPGGSARFDSFYSPSMGGSDRVAFLAGLRDTAGGTFDDLAIFAMGGSGPGSFAIARENDVVPGGNGQFNDFGDPSTEQHGISIAGDKIAFQASIRGAASGVEEEGIFAFNGTYLRKVVRENDVVPGGDGKFMSFGPPAINGNGHIAFLTNLKDTADPNADQGLFLYIEGLGLTQIARKGDTIGGVVLGGSPFLADGCGTGTGQACGLNGSDQIAFQASLLTGGTGVFLYTPGPALPGDYNNDHIVNAADYTVWRNNLGSSNTLPNDETPGQVTAADYGVWKTHYGQTGPGSGAANTAALPEPPGAVLLFFLAATITLGGRPKKSQSSN